MADSPHLPIFNLRYSNTNTSFHLFSNLPKELRLLSWRHALRRHRIIKLHLSDPALEDPTTIRAKLVNINATEYIGSGHYVVTLDGRNALSKLLHVCRESREETLLHYRARIPCRFVRDSYPGIDTRLVTAIVEDRLHSVLTRGIFHFNPEWDFLSITCWPSATSVLPAFLHDLRTRYDPRGVGLLNLVVARNGSGGSGLLDIEPSLVSPALRTSIGQTLRDLQDIFLQETVTCGRMNLGIAWGGLSWKVWFNRSMPISTEVQTFDRIGADPRPVSRDLEKQYIGSMGGRQYARYTHFLSQFGVSPAETSTQVRFMMSHNSGVSGIHSREDAARWLEDDYNRGWVNRQGWPSKAKEVMEDQEYVMDVEPAFGFWLFSLEALDAKTSACGERLYDMSKYTPELGLAIMP